MIKLKTLKKLRILNIIIFIILIISITQILLVYYQLSRYVKDVYDCSDMSIDCANFFTSIGIKTRYVHGWYYDNTTKFGKSFHVWLELDFGLFKLPFESTLLLFISPTIFQDYNEIKITEEHNKLIDTWGDDIYTR